MRDRLDLKGLPRVDASEGFTETVLRRLRTDQAHRPTLRRPHADPTRRPALRWRLAAAAAVVIASTAAGAWWARQSAPVPPPDPAPLTAESIEELKFEHQQLIQELESLRRLAEDTQPFVPVSIDPQTEILFDLRDIEPLPVRYAAASSRRIQ